MMGYSLMLAKRVEILDDTYPEVLRYQEGLESRPGWAKAMV